MSNEAAERLRQWLAVDGRYVDAHPMIDQLLDAALAAERRATVERIEPVVAALRTLVEWARQEADEQGIEIEEVDELGEAERVLAILDAEAER